MTQVMQLRTKHFKKECVAGGPQLQHHQTLQILKHLCMWVGTYLNVSIWTHTHTPTHKSLIYKRVPAHANECEHLQQFAVLVRDKIFGTHCTKKSCRKIRGSLHKLWEAGAAGVAPGDIKSY